MYIWATKSVVSAEMNLITNSEFTIYLFGIFAFVFLPPWIIGKATFYEEYFAKSSKTRFLVVPPRAKTLSLYSLVTNAFLSAAAIYYLWMYRDPTTESKQQYYVAIEALLISLCALKYLFFYILFNFHRRTVGIILSFLSIVLTLAISFILIILFGIENSWVSFAMMFPPTIFYLLLIIWTYQIWKHAKCKTETVV